MLLLLHGTGAATHSWRALAPLLAERFTVVAPDLPGHGFTTGRPRGGAGDAGDGARGRRPAGRRSAFAPTRSSAIRRGRRSRCGWRSTGVAAPDTIVGLDAALLPFPGLAARLFPTLARLLFVNPLAPHALRADGADARRDRAVPGPQHRLADRCRGRRCYERLFATPGHCAGRDRDDGGLGPRPRWRATCRGSRRRCCWSTATRDAAIPIATAREAAALVGDGRLVPLPGLGHLAHEERPAEVAALIRDFLEDR